MTIELTARLTLSSCVSQLTDFYSTDMIDLFLDNGMLPVEIKLCDSNGELYPYVIGLDPLGQKANSFQIDGLVFKVMKNIAVNSDPYYEILFTGSIEKGSMVTKNLYKCALHVCGDFIKFNEKGL